MLTSTLKDKIDTLLFINSKACEQSLKDIIRSKNYSIDDIKERNIKIGPLVSGEAYFHEKDQYYEVIGFLVCSECQFKGSRIKTYGFRSIYFGNCDDMAPVDFDEGDSLEPSGTFHNGFGDKVEIYNVLANQNEVDNCIKENNIDINSYLKDVGLLLEKNNNSSEKINKEMEV